MVRSRSFFVAFVLSLCACSGGGGGGTPSGPSPTATPTPGSGAPTATPTPAASSTGVSTFSITTVPAGLGVTVKNGSSTQQFAAPVTITPVTSNLATVISIAPSNGAAPYVVSVDQHHAGPGSILYDQSADTTGSLGTVSSLPLARRASRAVLAARAARIANVPRFGPSNSASGRAYSDTDVIVRYRANVSRDAIERNLGVTRAYDLPIPGNAEAYRVLAVPAGVSVDAFVANLRGRSEFASVDYDVLYSKESVAAVVPNDTHFNSYDQWDMYDIGAPNAWGYTRGNAAIQIAMIDTGVDTTSPDFAGGKITHAASIIGGVITQGLAAVQDSDGHGTNTAGIAAAATNDNFGFAGTGYGVGLQIYRVFPTDTAANKYDSEAQEPDVVLAIDEAVNAGARVINLSLGSCQVEGDTVEEAAVEGAVARGVVVVASAGNERSGMSTVKTCANGSSTVDFPAAFDGVISVGATSLDDASDPEDPATAKEFVASYSNSGPGLSLVAPGGDPSQSEIDGTTPVDVLHWVFNLYSTTVANPQERCTDESDCTALFTGTSQAAPHVAGAAALMLSINPNLTSAQVKAILIATADDIGDPNQGSGRLDAYRALAVVDGDPNPPALPAKINFVAFAYVPNGTNRPQMLDVTYPKGVPVASNGAFRIADIPSGTANYEVGVWYDANGDGVVDAGDYFGNSQTCSSSVPCASAANITVAPVSSGFTLP